MYSHSRWNEMIERTFDEIRKLATHKGAEYSGDEDRLLNFRRNGRDLDLPQEVIWRIYASKHWDALGQYVRDLQTGKERVRLESIGGRVDDLLVYLLLFKAMLEEREMSNFQSGRPIISEQDLNEAVDRMPPVDTEAEDTRLVPRRRR